MKEKKNQNDMKLKKKNETIYKRQGFRKKKLKHINVFLRDYFIWEIKFNKDLYADTLYK